MTGRGLGFCAGNERLGFDAMPGRGWGGRFGAFGPGFGLRFGHRAGRGRRNMFYATGLPGWARADDVQAGSAPAADQELMDLKAQAGRLADQLDALTARIETLNRK